LISPEILGLPERLDRFSLEGKATWVKAFQDLTAVIDSLGLCLFTSFAINADDYKDLFNSIVGEDYSTDDIMRAGDRIWNLERMYNLEAGIGADQDTLPRRLLKDPIQNGPSKGHVHRLSELLPQYYKERGWSDAGLPTDAKLAELEISQG
jgi:aldehyde:ferredoxin oxidoreductase